MPDFVFGRGDCVRVRAFRLEVLFSTDSIEHLRQFDQIRFVSHRAQIELSEDEGH